MRREDDGTVSVRKALNTLLQAAGSIVMKYSLCFMDGWVKKDNLRCKQVIFYHKLVVVVKLDEFRETPPFS